MPPYGNREQRERELREREAELRGQAIDVGTPKPSADIEALLESPAVQAAIAKQVAEATARIVAELEAKRGGGQSDDRKFAEHLAVAIAQMAEQNNPRARRSVSPEVLQARAEATERMQAAIVRARAENRDALYELTGEVYLSEMFIRPEYAGDDHKMRRRRIVWPLSPNLAMRPVNDTAQEIHGHFLASIGIENAVRGQHDPLVRGFRVVDDKGDAPQVGGGRGALSNDAVRIQDEVTPGHFNDGVRILGSVAEPARPQNY